MKERTPIPEAPKLEVPVRMRSIVKRFPGVVANDHVDFDIQRGEIHGLLGENGAGKTTLMKILYGMYRPDEGEIYVNGQRVSILSPSHAISLGIGMVHQHFMLVPDMTILENVILGLKTRMGLGLGKKESREKLLAISKRYGLPVDPDSYVWQLSVGERQRVEILKALYREVKILILDEPTAVVAPQEVDQLFSALRDLKKEGLAIVLITHKLDEIMGVADRVTVLRNGRHVATTNVSQVNSRMLAELMIGREISHEVRKQPVETMETILNVERLRVLDDRGAEWVRGVSFSVRRGEIFGIAGVSGNGQRELTEAIVGLRRALGGHIVLRGRDVTNLSPYEILPRGVAYIPEERNRDAAINDFSVAENLILKRQRDPSITRNGILMIPEQIDNLAKRLVEQFDVRTPSVKTTAISLSGGNLQRMILARELSGKPDLVVAGQPTRGLDIAATEYVRRKLVDMRNAGAAVLLVSEDLDEVLTLSDTVGVMYRGELAGVLRPQEVSIEDVGLMMTGVKRMDVVAT